MTEKEHEQLIAIAPDMLPAGFYFRGFNGKRNFAPPAEKSDWFKLENIDLLNGDAIGVATSWTYPATMEDIPPEVVDHIIADIGVGCRTAGGFPTTTAQPNGRRGRSWQKHCPNKTESQCRRAVAKWIKQGVLYEDEYWDPTQRRTQVGLFVRKPGNPTPEKTES